MRWLRRLGYLLHRGRQRELAEEMQFHQEMMAAAGTPAARFGNDLLLRERSREAWGWVWAQQFGQDVRLAWRQLRRAPGFAVAAIAILALGIGANTALFSVLNAVVLHPLPYKDPDRIVSVTDMPKFPDEVHAFTENARYEPGTTNLSGAGTAQRLQAAEVTASFFPLFGVALRGRNFTVDEQTPGRDGVAIVSESLARELGVSVVGREIQLNGRTTAVVGVAPAGFDFPQRTQVWLPFPVPWSFAGEKMSNEIIFFEFLARLRPGVSPLQAHQELLARAQLPKGYPKDAQDYGQVEPLQSALVGDAGRALWMLVAAVGLVLLIACANVASLQLARVVTRGKEMSLRAALGASRGRLLRQAVAESLLLASLGGGAGLLLAELTLPALRALLPASLPLFAPLTLSGPTLAFTAVVALGSGLVFGCIPAMQMSRRNPRELRRTRAVLVSIEVAAAVMLLAGSGLLLRSFARLMSTDPGFDAKRVLTAEINLGNDLSTPGRQAQFYSRVLAQVAELPGVETVGLSSNLPMDPESRYMGLRLGTLEPSRRAGGDTPVLVSDVSPDFFAVMGVRLMEGRGFSGLDVAGATRVAILSRQLAESLWPGESAVGKHISLPGNPGTKPAWREVVGVVGDLRLQMGSAARPFVYLPLAQSSSPSVYLEVRAGGVAAGLAAGIRHAVATVNPNQAVANFVSEDALVANSVAAPRFRTLLLALFAGLALLLSAAGLGGAMAYWAARRRTEIGIRMALGAAPRAVLRLVVAEGMKLVTAGLVAGLLGALLLSRLLQHFLYQVAPRDPLVFTGAAVLMALVGAIACWLPARRAAGTDPLAVLREE